jgi:circadian clock protein KaiB
VSRGPIFRFRLYVAGTTHNSGQALSNLTAMCNAYVPDRHHIEIVDIFRDPDRALGDGIFMTPTLVRLGPLPSRRIVGTLSQTQPVLQALGLEALPS